MRIQFRLTEPASRCVATIACVGFLVTSFSAGCGSFSEDKFARAARRARIAEDEADPSAAATPQTPPPLSTAVSNAPPTNPEGGSPAAPASVVASDQPPAAAVQDPTSQAEAAADGTIAVSESEPVDLGNIPDPISLRKPTEVLSDEQRRLHAAKNVQRVAEALLAYMSKNGTLPPTVVKNEQGIPCLSWRVALLPYLGYEGLYQKFNLNEPWDTPHNRALLELIPPEFVSPERFDEKTNIMVATGEACLFDLRRPPLSSGDVIDGLPNTLLVLEVDDAIAAPWTKPADYEVLHYQPTKRIGHLRGDGTIAAWGNGLLTLLSNSLPPASIYQAMTYAGEDGQLAGAVHKPISLEDPASGLGEEEGEDSLLSGLTESPAADVPGVPGLVPESAQRLRIPLPSSSELKAAQQQLREIYKDRLADARTDTERRDLARHLIDAARDTTSDSPAQYAVLLAARSIAVDAGDFALAEEASDGIVYYFEMELYKARMELLLDYGKRWAGQEQRQGDAGPFVRLTLPTLYGAVKADDYADVQELGRLVAAWQRRNQAVALDAPALSALQRSLKDASRKYGLLSKSLNTLLRSPDDPVAATAVGRYLCFVKGQWEEGLPLLAKGASAALADAIKADGEVGSDPSKAFVAAERWWQLGLDTTDKETSAGYKERARRWYEIAEAGLPAGREKLAARVRLDEYKELYPSEPLLLIEQLAKQQGLSLRDMLSSGSRFRPDRADAGGSDEES